MGGKSDRTSRSTKKVTRNCKRCGVAGGTDQSGFSPRSDRPGRTSAICRACNNARNRESYEAAMRRRDSDYAALKPEDFDVGVGNDGRIDPEAAQQKRQEYSEAMGEFADSLHTSAGDPDGIKGQLGTYIANLAEQERRFGNRRLARSVSLSAAHEALARRQFMDAAREYLSDKVVPTGYATLKPEGFRPKRTDLILLTDLHFGSELCPRENPRPYTAVEEARCFEYVVRQVIDYKPQYREDSDLVVVLGGDLIEGMLDHDRRSGAPLVEQKVRFYKYMSAAIGLFAQTFKKVHIECQPGNHGRDKLRHPGRATESKWDGHEWEMYYALSRMCSGLKNVTWSMPLMGISVLKLYNWNFGITHGDTEVKLVDPDQTAKNMAILDAINANRTYGVEFQVFLYGHFHKGRYIPGNVIQIANPALVPPNGHARTSGYIRERTGQWLFEVTEGHPVGDLRLIEVSREQGRDERLGKLIVPFDFDQDMVGAS